MKIKIIRGLCIAPGVDAHINDVLDVDDNRAQQLINAGKAVAVVDIKPKADKKETKK
jgi:adenine deaminase